MSYEFFWIVEEEEVIVFYVSLGGSKFVLFILCELEGECVVFFNLDYDFL